VSGSANALRDNDTRLAELARDISAAQWAKPSLCTQWTNHEVLAHLVIGYGVALSAVTTSMLRHRGSFDAANTDLARSLAAHREPGQLLDDFIALARHPRGIGRIFPRQLLLGDHVIHDWSHRADGPTVTGRAAHLASVLAGRPCALPYLSGDGVATLSDRM
jgi:uncharacterized protein (TIGR03083 family)